MVNALVSLVLLLTLAACGGGDSSTAGNSGDQLMASQFNADQRSVATQRIDDKYEELVAANIPNPWEELKAYVLTQPEFVDAGVGENQLWAKFKDGRYFLYLDNWKVPLTAGQPFVQEASLRASPAPIALTSSASVRELPASAQAKLFMIDADEFKNFGGGDVLEKGAQALQKQGWNASMSIDFSVEALKSIGTVGLLYLNTHSGVLGPDDQKQYAMITSTQSTWENEIKYADELADGTLIYTRDRTLKQAVGFGRFPNYAITPKFVRKYWNFSDNSLVILMACHGGESAASKFRDALTAKHAGTIIGWNGSSNPNGYEMVKRLFDRLTGANAVDPKSPPNRAFDFDDVWDYLEREGYLFTPAIEKGDEPVAVKRFGGGFDLTNPVITELQVTVNNWLILHGEFGTEPGKVSIDGVDVPASWSADGAAIQVALPTGANDSPGSYGNVVVTTRGRKSNSRTLASWRGQLTYLYEDLPDEGGTGTLTQQIVVDLHLRGDPYAMRTAVNGSLFNNTWNVIPASDTTSKWSASGTRSFDGPFETWSGSGSLDFEAPYTGKAFSMVARINAVDKRLELTPMFPQFPLVTVTKYDGNSPPYKRPVDVKLENYGFYRPEATDWSDHKPLMYGTYIPLDAQMNVPASQHVDNISSTERVTVKWTQMNVMPKFDGSIGR
ncbi:MAG TPA: hypothetical protein VJ577_05355 [Burkholderiaceae bacterium]|nr:hypothetical protein [Burkholderiaceae bacterium]